MNTEFILVPCSFKSIVCIICFSFQCFEMNRFVAFNSENDIEKNGMELIQENKLWAGIVFTNLDKRDQLPHYIQYKIRMAASKVDSTKRVEDR